MIIKKFKKKFSTIRIIKGEIFGLNFTIRVHAYKSPWKLLREMSEEI